MRYSSSLLSCIAIVLVTFACAEQRKPHASSGKSNVALIEACKSADLSQVKRAINEGANPRVTDQYGFSAIIVAAKAGSTDIVSFLIACGVGINERSSSITPLHAATVSGNALLVSYLLNHGANSEAGDHQHSTPLQYACAFGKVECVRVLLEHGANPNAKSEYDNTPLFDAAWEGTVEIAQLLVSYGALVNALTIDNETPIHAAAQQGKLEMVKYLITKGADPNARNRSGQSAHDLADRFGQKEVAAYLSSIGV